VKTNTTLLTFRFNLRLNHSGEIGLVLKIFKVGTRSGVEHQKDPMPFKRQI